MAAIGFHATKGFVALDLTPAIEKPMCETARVPFPCGQGWPRGVRSRTTRQADL
jgi:hypothetical protein